MVCCISLCTQECRKANTQRRVYISLTVHIAEINVKLALVCFVILVSAHCEATAIALDSLGEDHICCSLLNIHAEAEHLETGIWKLILTTPQRITQLSREGNLVVNIIMEAVRDNVIVGILLMSISTSFSMLSSLCHRYPHYRRLEWW